MSRNPQEENPRPSRLDRRRFLGLAAAGGGAMLCPPVWRPSVLAAPPTPRGVLVSLLLRGGADGLALCAPTADPDYSALRPTLAPSGPARDRAVIDLDGFFALPPPMAVLEEAYRSGDLLFVHACGLPSSSRSHFEAVELLELGQPAGAAPPRSGWLGRHLAVSGPPREEPPVRAVAIGWGLPLRLMGAPAAVALPSPEKGVACGSRGGLGVAAAEALQRLHLESYRPSGGAEYPENDLGSALRCAAALIKSDLPVETVTIEVGGWDTHADQETRLRPVMADFARGLAAFHLDLATDRPREWALTALSEFGRSAVENRDGGTDHGTGGILLAMGGPIRGGRVLSDWPGLAPDQLVDGRDLAVTIDYRDVVREILERLHGPVHPADLFPDPSWVPRRKGIVAA